jgi:hypothetical protein
VLRFWLDRGAGRAPAPWKRGGQRGWMRARAAGRL